MATAFRAAGHILIFDRSIVFRTDADLSRPSAMIFSNHEDRYPAILPMLGEGLLSLATVRLLASHLTAENQRELLAQAAGKSKRAVEEMVAWYFPRPDVPSSIRGSCPQ